MGPAGGQRGRQPRPQVCRGQYVDLKYDEVSMSTSIMSRSVCRPQVCRGQGHTPSVSRVIGRVQVSRVTEAVCSGYYGDLAPGTECVLGPSTCQVTQVMAM